MSENQINLQLETRTAIELLLVLDTATQGYSQEFAPERILRLRKLMVDLDKNLEKSILDKE